MSNVNLIVAAGSVDGVLTSSAALRIFESAEVVFTQAFQVNTLKPEEWEAGRQILFVDLAVNNKDEAMTSDFVSRIKNSGHEIVGICDEHDAVAWERVLSANGLDISALLIQPVSQKTSDIKSSGALFLQWLDNQKIFWLDEEAEQHLASLCQQADAADRMDFSGFFASIANKAVKSKIQDNSRRVYLAKHFASATTADETIQGWMAEYDAILANHAEIVAAKRDLGNGLVQVDAGKLQIDATTLLFSLYKDYKVVELIASAFNPATKQVELLHSFATGDKTFDVLATIKAAGVNASGFASKANVLPVEADEARAAVIAALAA